MDVGTFGGHTVGTHGSIDRRCRQQTSRGGSVEFCLWSRRSSAQYGFRGTRVGEASHPGPSFLRLRRATSAVAESLHRVDSGRFSVLDEDLGDREVDEGGDTADFRGRTVNESPANVSCAGAPIVSRRRLVLVSQREVAPIVMDGTLSHQQGFARGVQCREHPH